MTIPEAVALILQAITYADGGEIFVLDMGKPVKIYDLAVSLIKLSGYEPEVDIPIKFTGLREGEKLYEELLMAEEGLTATTHNKIFISKPMDISLKELENKLSKLHNLNENSDTLECDVRKVMKQVVPTYKEPDVVNKKAMENKVNLKLQTVNGKNKDKKSKEKKDNCDLELMRKEG
ncbi:polysaccharide biosynthesis protein CapD [Clostridium sp. CAG:921]|nr:polysaccharide biosynthesis protein CapD [Clostridium sp. CAG:921]